MKHGEFDEQKDFSYCRRRKKEPQLLNCLFDTYMYKKRQIVSYGANIYDLYERIQRYYGEDLEDLDF